MKYWLISRNSSLNIGMNILKHIVSKVIKFLVPKTTIEAWIIEGYERKKLEGNDENFYLLEAYQGDVFVNGVPKEHRPHVQT